MGMPITGACHVELDNVADFYSESCCCGGVSDHIETPAWSAIRRGFAPCPSLGFMCHWLSLLCNDHGDPNDVRSRY